MDLKALRECYSTGLMPCDVIQRLYPLLAAETGMFICLLSLEDLMARCRSCAEAPSSNVLNPISTYGFQLKPACLFTRRIMW